MGRAFRLGRLFGVELRVDPSWLFIFLLVCWSLTSLFAAWHPDWLVGTSFVVALAAALLFFGSVLVHELAHSLVARAYGIPVRDITLHLFGGVSSIEKEPPTPGAEFLIAIVGPIVSIGLGVLMMIFSLLSMNLDTQSIDSAQVVASQLDPLSTLLVWLGPVNVVVGLFNLLPGFPLDGGRVLRALIWKITGSLRRATWISSVVGQVVGFGFVGLGILMAFGQPVPFFGRGLGAGLWLAMIGLFLRNAAVAHQRGAIIDEALAGAHVGDLMRTQGETVDAELNLRDLIDGWFMRHDQPAYPVLDDGAFVGIITVDDVRLGGDPGVWSMRRIRDIMTPLSRLVMTRPDEALSTALRKLGAEGVRQLPVLDDRGVLVGMLFERDVARWLEFHHNEHAIGGGLGGGVAPHGTMHPRHA
jgi:Zn-dependent protease